jgi:hypothetical protein
MVAEELNLTEEESTEVDASKREFMKKFGKYAATAPLGMYLLMGPGASKAQASGSTCHRHGDFRIPKGNKCKIVKYKADGSMHHYTIEANTKRPFNNNRRFHVEVKVENGQKTISRITNARGKVKTLDTLTPFHRSMVEELLSMINC